LKSIENILRGFSSRGWVGGYEKIPNMEKAVVRLVFLNSKVDYDASTTLQKRDRKKCGPI